MAGRKRRRALAVTALALIAAATVMAVVCEMSLIVVTAVVCTTWGCTRTVYHDWVMECRLTSQDPWDSDGWPLPNDDPPDDPWGDIAMPYDNDINGVIDSFDQVIDTSDPCAWNFDTGDRLGSDNGGPNTIRPGHDGVDIQGDQGDTVYAVASGTVGDNVSDSRSGCAGEDEGYGCRIEIHHLDGSTTLYGHLASPPPLGPGAFVQAGQAIGEVGESGNATGPHLHLEYKDSDGQLQEYFDYTDSGPSQDNLDAGGC